MRPGWCRLWPWQSADGAPSQVFGGWPWCWLSWCGFWLQEVQSWAWCLVEGKRWLQLGFAGALNFKRRSVVTSAPELSRLQSKASPRSASQRQARVWLIRQHASSHTTVFLVHHAPNTTGPKSSNGSVAGPSHMLLDPISFLTAIKHTSVYAMTALTRSTFALRAGPFGAPRG